MIMWTNCNVSSPHSDSLLLQYLAKNNSRWWQMTTLLSKLHRHICRVLRRLRIEIVVYVTPCSLLRVTAAHGWKRVSEKTHHCELPEKVNAHVVMLIDWLSGGWVCLISNYSGMTGYLQWPFPGSPLHILLICPLNLPCMPEIWPCSGASWSPPINLTAG